MTTKTIQKLVEVELKKMDKAFQAIREEKCYVPKNLAFYMDQEQGGLNFISLQDFILDDVASEAGVDIRTDFQDLPAVERHRSQMRLTEHMLSLGLVVVSPNPHVTIH